MNATQQRVPVPPTPPPVRSRFQKVKQHVPRVRSRPEKSKKVRRELSAGGVAVRQERGLWMVALLKTEHRRGQVWVLPNDSNTRERNCLTLYKINCHVI